MGRQFVEFELQSIENINVSSLKTKDEVSISLQPQGILQVLVRALHLKSNCSCNNFCKYRETTATHRRGDIPLPADEHRAAVGCRTAR